MNSRIYEYLASQGKGLARSSSVPKSCGEAAPVAFGQGHIVGDVVNGFKPSGITRTSVLNAPDASGATPMDPTVGHNKHAQVEIHSGMRSRRDIDKAHHDPVPGFFVNGAERTRHIGTALHEVRGKRLLEQGEAMDAQHPNNMARRLRDAASK
jgi:hypothetical protein